MIDMSSSELQLYSTQQIGNAAAMFHQNISHKILNMQLNWVYKKHRCEHGSKIKGKPTSQQQTKYKALKILE